MTNLRLSLIEMDIHGITKHPLTFLKDLGITYKSCEPVPMGDCWLLYDCNGFIPVEYKSLFDTF